MTNRILLGLLAWTLTASAGPIAVSGSSTFVGGLYGLWTHTFSAGPSDLTIQQIEIDVAPANLIFDTVLGGSGALLPEPFAAVSGSSATGFTGFSPASSALDGLSKVTLSFTDFGLGETFIHTGDVDRTASCSGLSGLALLTCQTGNATVNGNQFAGSTIKVTLGGAGYQTTTLTSTFVRTNELTAVASWSGVVETVPEPSTYAMLAAGLMTLVCARRLRA